MSRNTLMVFAKNPVLGKVKTRLAKSIGDPEALEAYLEMLKYTRAVLNELDAVDKEIWYSWKDEPTLDWLDKDCHTKYQKEGDLGSKLQYAFRTAFLTSNKVVVIGTDCPEISEAHLQHAFEALDRYDAVLGPAEDGGYYLIGMNKYHPDVFNNIDWSTEFVANQSRSQIAKLGWSLTELETLQDIDTVAEYARWKTAVSS